MKTIRQLLLEHNRRKRGGSLRDYIMKAPGTIWSMTKGLASLTKNMGTTVMKYSAPYVYMKSALHDWLDLINWARNYGKDLPDLAPELSLFIEQSESGPSTTQTRNKAIIARLVDMNKRYLQLNTTPAKDAFNRVMATTTLNSIRNPSKASDYIAEAELDLGTLFRDILGSSQDSKPKVSPNIDKPMSWPKYIATLPYHTSQYVSNLPYAAAKAAYNNLAPQSVIDYFDPPEHAQVYDKYELVEPHNIVKKFDREDALPSSVLSRVQFPDALTSGQYVPSYEKQRYLQAAIELHPVYKRRKDIDLKVQMRRKKRKYIRGRKMRR